MDKGFTLIMPDFRYGYCVDENEFGWFWYK